jgi:hypothetical protein
LEVLQDALREERRGQGEIPLPADPLAAASRCSSPSRLHRATRDRRSIVRRWPWRRRLAVVALLVAGVAFGLLAASLAAPGAEVPGAAGVVTHRGGHPRRADAGVGPARPSTWGTAGQGLHSTGAR